jgi:hypothetical protein
MGGEFNPGVDIRCDRCGMPIVEAEHLHTVNDKLVCDECLPLALAVAVVMCDFCSGPDPVWRYQARPLVVDQLVISDHGEVAAMPTFISNGDWAACERCHELMEAKNFAEIARMTATRTLSAIGRSPEEEDYFRSVQAAMELFFANVDRALVHPGKKEV